MNYATWKNEQQEIFSYIRCAALFSFLLVFLLHIPVPENSVLSFFTKSGGIGVSFFFVLSGFLISYILMHEKIIAGKISLKNFFIRRVLRIWPLFYGAILFAFLTPFILEFLKLSSSSEGYKPDWLLSVFFLENYKMMFSGSFPNVSPLRVMWSLCVEEHFYILWGIVFYFLPLKYVPRLIVASIVLANISRVIYFQYSIESLDLFSNIDYFAFGAIPTFILLKRNDLLKKLERLDIKLKYLLCGLTIATVFLLPNLNYQIIYFLSPAILGLLFCLVIAFTLPSINYVCIGDKRIVSKLGKYTYGLYLIHTVVINLVMNVQGIFPFKMDWILVSLISLLLTILISILSYHLFEKQFLKLKKYFY